MIKRVTSLLISFATLSAATTYAITGGSVAPEFHGQWVPAKASCTASLKTIIEANKVTFINGTQKAVYAKLDQCFTCMGPEVDNIVWLTTDAMGDSPFTIYLDKSKKTPAIQVMFDNDKKLGARFPFGKGFLKKCSLTTGE